MARLMPVRRPLTLVRWPALPSVSVPVLVRMQALVPQRVGPGALRVRILANTRPAGQGWSTAGFQ